MIGPVRMVKNPAFVPEQGPREGRVEMRRLLLMLVPAVALLLVSAWACGSDTSPKATSDGGTPTEAASGGEGFPEEEFQNLLEMDPNNFDNSTVIDNEWWPLTPGTRLVYEGFTVENGEKVPHRVEDTITDLTKVINGVRTLVSLEKDFSDGEMIESEIVFHAQDNDGNVWHLGQLRETYDEVEFVGGRVWFVGVPDGAKAGIRMQADPQLGTPSYSQGFAPAPFAWTDRARVYQMGQKTTVAVGSYEDVMVIQEADQETEPGVFQLKYYARGVGVVRIGYLGDDPEKEEMELVEITKLSPDQLAAVRAEALGVEQRAYMYSQTPPAK